MYRVLTVLFLVILLSGNAFANKWPQIQPYIKYSFGMSRLYVNDYQNNTINFYNSKDKLTLTDWKKLECFQQRDIFSCIINDTKNHGCIYVNLSNGKVSKFYSNQNWFGIDNNKEKVTLLYYPNEQKFVFQPMFENCKKSYFVKINADKYGPALYSTFLPNGDAYIKYSELGTGKQYATTIKVDYKKLYDLCLGG